MNINTARLTIFARIGIKTPMMIVRDCRMYCLGYQDSCASLMCYFALKVK